MLDSLSTHRTILVTGLALFAGLSSIFVLWRPASGAANVLPGFQDSEFVTGLQQPTAMEFAPDGRLFVAEIGGAIRVVQSDGTLNPVPFVTIPDVDARGNRGVQGLTFDPDFSTNHFVYVHYTQKGSDGKPSHNRIVRFTADGDVAAEEDGTPKMVSIFELDNLGRSKQHNGGHIHFNDEDGDHKLYIPVGDNKRNKFPPFLKTMKLTNLFGKVLRINADGSIPSDNPFYNETTGKYKAIYARGFRNPFSFAVEQGTGEGRDSIYINDVGEQTWEEINDLRAGANYGWPRHEGYQGGDRFERPIFAYRHDTLDNTPPATSGCAITAGTFYHALADASAYFPAEYEGDYFFADLCNGWIRKLEHLDSGDVSASGFATGVRGPVDLKVGPDGGLYYLEIGPGSVGVIRPQ
jgi:glucose/arabinose dehydrogenase